MGNTRSPPCALMLQVLEDSPGRDDLVLWMQEPERRSRRRQDGGMLLAAAERWPPPRAGSGPIPLATIRIVDHDLRRQRDGSGLVVVTYCGTLEDGAQGA